MPFCSKLSLTPGESWIAPVGALPNVSAISVCYLPRIRELKCTFDLGSGGWSVSSTGHGRDLFPSSSSRLVLSAEIESEKTQSQAVYQLQGSVQKNRDQAGSGSGALDPVKTLTFHFERRRGTDRKTSGNGGGCAPLLSED